MTKQSHALISHITPGYLAGTCTTWLCPPLDGTPSANRSATRPSSHSRSSRAGHLHCEMIRRNFGRTHQSTTRMEIGAVHCTAHPTKHCSVSPGLRTLTAVASDSQLDVLMCDYPLTPLLPVANGSLVLISCAFRQALHGQWWLFPEHFLPRR